MKDGAVYTLVYTVGLCCVCAAMLTGANTRWASLISANEDLARIHALVDALGLYEGPVDRGRVLAVFSRDIAYKPKGELPVFEGVRAGVPAGYALELEGRGKYGPIRGILAIDAGGTAIKALRIYEQNETPGLGGMITSRDWLDKFAGKPLVTNGSPGVIISNTVSGPNVIDAVSGASKTMHSFGQMLNAAIASFLSGGMVLEPLDLRLTEDQVTRGTPGYPRHFETPAHLRAEVQRADFMVPPGVTNIALGRSVTSSLEMEPIMGELSQLTDGVRTCGEFDFVELDPGPQWVQVDLGEPRRIFCIVVWHHYKNAIVYRDVAVQIAADEAFTADVRTLFNNDDDDSLGLGAGTDTVYFARWWGELVDTRGDDHLGTLTRYIRVWTNGGYADEETRLVEVAAYGREQ